MVPRRATERTQIRRAVTSPMGQEQTQAPYLTNVLFNQLVSTIEQLAWDSQAIRLICSCEPASHKWLNPNSLNFY